MLATSTGGGGVGGGGGGGSVNGNQLSMVKSDLSILSDDVNLLRRETRRTADGLFQKIRALTQSVSGMEVSIHSAEAALSEKLVSAAAAMRSENRELLSSFRTSVLSEKGGVEKERVRLEELFRDVTADSRRVREQCAQVDMRAAQSAREASEAQRNVRTLQLRIEEANARQASESAGIRRALGEFEDGVGKVCRSMVEDIEGLKKTVARMTKENLETGQGSIRGIRTGAEERLEGAAQAEMGEEEGKGDN